MGKIVSSWVRLACVALLCVAACGVYPQPITPQNPLYALIMEADQEFRVVCGNACPTFAYMEMTDSAHMPCSSTGRVFSQGLLHGEIYICTERALYYRDLFGPLAVKGVVWHEMGHQWDALVAYAGGYKELSKLLFNWTRELRADYWAGCAHRFNGYKYEPYMNLLVDFGLEGSKTHPGAAMRMQAFIDGSKCPEEPWLLEEIYVER